MDKGMKAEIKKELCRLCSYIGICNSDNCKKHDQATSSLTSLIIKWLESKKQTEGYINLAMENCNQLITELIGEVR